MKNLSNFLVCFIALVLGLFGGGIYVTYKTLPETDELVETDDQFYSFNASGEVSTAEFNNAENVFSVHFLELGNKYTGDCTYIKYNDIDILIDCGSRSNSVTTVSNYLNKYVTDNTLEYVIVTHAHRDHYAGFASTKSIFDLFKCETIIDFGNATNQADGSSTYERYKKNRDAEISKENGTYIPAIDCRNADGTNREFVIDAENNVKFEVLYNYYSSYDKTKAVATSSFKASSENDYSVCTLFSYGEQKFLFTGDLESGENGNKGGEEYLVEKNQSLLDLKNNGKTHGVTLYKAGHHGSKTSSGETLLEAIRPEYVGICCCAGSYEYTTNNNNTFPTQAFINRIAQYTDKIYVTTLCVDWEKSEYTSLNGNIVFWIDVDLEQVNLDCSNNNKKLRETDWFANNRTNPWTA